MFIGNDKQEKKERLHENYEQLRSYALSPTKAPLQPLGLDLWIKKGFSAWSAIMLRKEILPPASTAPVGDENKKTRLSTDLLISLTNILIDWSDKNGEYNKQ